MIVDEEEQENEEGWWFVPTDQLNANHRSDILGVANVIGTFIVVGPPDQPESTPSKSALFFLTHNYESIKANHGIQSQVGHLIIGGGGYLPSSPLKSTFYLEIDFSF